MRGISEPYSKHKEPKKVAPEVKPKQDFEIEFDDEQMEVNSRNSKRFYKGIRIK